VDFDAEPAESSLADARKGLGAAAFDHAWAEGAKLSLDEAIGLAVPREDEVR